MSADGSLTFAEALDFDKGYPEFRVDQERDELGRFSGAGSKQHALSFSNLRTVRTLIRRRLSGITGVDIKVSSTNEGEKKVSVIVPNMGGLHFIVHNDRVITLNSIYAPRKGNQDFARTALGLLFDSAIATGAKSIDLYAVEVGAYLWPRLGFDLRVEPESELRSMRTESGAVDNFLSGWSGVNIRKARDVLPSDIIEKLDNVLSVRDITLPTRLAKLDYELSSDDYQSINGYRPRGRPTLGKALLFNTNGQYTLPRAKFGVLKQYSTLTKAFDPEQQRAPDGSWIGGAEGKLRPGSEAMDLLGHNLRQKQTPSFDDFIDKAGYNPNQRRDDHGRWTSGESDGPVFNLRGKNETEIERMIRSQLPPVFSATERDGRLSSDDPNTEVSVYKRRGRVLVDIYHHDDEGGLISNGRFEYVLRRKVLEADNVEAKDTPEGRAESLAIMRAMLRVAIDNDAKEIEVNAGLSMGGYLWPRIGFDHKDMEEAENVHAKVTARLAGVGSLISEQQYKDVLRILDEPVSRDFATKIAHLDSLVVSSELVEAARDSEVRGRLALGKIMLAGGIGIGTYVLPRDKFSKLKILGVVNKAAGDPGTRENPIRPETADDIAAASVHTPEELTQGQREAGNYPKGHLDIHGFGISIETPKGAIRRGKGWQCLSPAAYGYFRGQGVKARAQDGEHPDVYVGDNPTSERAFIVDQYERGTDKFDEPKIILGVDSEDEAIALYDAGFSDGGGPERRGSVTEITIQELKDWLQSGDATKPYVNALDKALTFNQALEKAGYRDDEPRDDHGQWTREGGGFSRRNLLRAAVAVVLGLGIAHLPLGVLAIRNVLNGRPWYHNVAVPEAEMELPEVKALKAKGYRFEKRPDGQYNVRPPLDKALAFDEVLQKNLDKDRSSEQILDGLIRSAKAGLKGDLSEHIDEICDRLYALQHKDDIPAAGKGWHTALSNMADALEHMVYGDVQKAGFNPEQERDDRGRWTNAAGFKAPVLSSEMIRRSSLLPVSKSERAAIRSYVDESNNHGYDVNLALRNTGGDNEKLPLDIRTTVKSLDALLSRYTTTKDATVYRGVFGDGLRDLLSKISGTNSKFVSDQYMSTSMDEQFASDFGSSYGKGSKVMEILIPKGSHVGPLVNFVDDAYKHEQEILLPRGSRLDHVGTRTGLAYWLDEGSEDLPRNRTVTYYQFRLLPSSLYKARMFEVDKANFNPQQARDNRGRWVAGGGSGAFQERSSRGSAAEAAKPLKEAAKAIASLQEGAKPATVDDKVSAATSEFKNIVKQPGWWEGLDEETKTEVLTLAANVVAIAAAALFIYYGVRPNLPHDIGGWLKFLLGWK